MLPQNTKGLKKMIERSYNDDKMVKIKKIVYLIH